MNRLILFLIRKKLGLKKYDGFKFANQKNKKDYYFIGKSYIWKYDSMRNSYIESHVSLNWLLDKNCKIVREKKGEGK